VSPFTSKTAYRDGTTHADFNPPDFIARLAAEKCQQLAGMMTPSVARVFLTFFAPP